MMETNGKEIQAIRIDGFSDGVLDKKRVLAWLFGTRREFGFKTASTPEGKFQLDGGLATVNSLIRAINSGTFDTR